MKNLKDCSKFTKSQWAKMQIKFPPEGNRACVRQDDNGKLWIWVTAIKTVYAAPFFGK
jgi:hypothetical protein